jgi:DNA-binding CsgD family transcriptional regulator/ligand-binding sensor domain-containing protein
VRNLYLLLAACLLTFALPAQEIPRVHSFQAQQYQAQRQNWSAAQSGEGYMYFANSAGVLEYDGARWELLPLPHRQVVRAVACARDRVFCGGFAEFGYWEKAPLGPWSYHSLSENVGSEKARTEEIWHILALEDFVLFQSFSTIFLYDYEKTTTLTPPGSIMFVQTVNERLLFQVLEKGLYELLPDHSFRYLAGTEALAETTVSTLIPLGADEFLAGTTNHGVFHYRNGRLAPWDNPVNEQLKNFQLNKGLALQDGGLAFGTILNGLFVLNADGSLRLHLNQENGLQNNTVLALLEDRDHNLWAGLDRGIDLVEIRSPLTFFTDRSGKTGTVYAAALHEDRLYIGTNHGVFFRKWGDDAPFQLIEGTQGQVWELKVFDGQLLCGHNEGTFAIEGRQARKISSVTGGWSTIRHPKRDDMLVQGTYYGIGIYRKGDGGQWVFSHRIEGFLEPIKEVLFDPSGNLWAVHAYRGLHRIRLDADAQQILEIQHFLSPGELPSDLNLHIALIRDTLLIHSDTAFFTYREDIRQLKQVGQVGSIQLPGQSHVLRGSAADWFLATDKGLQVHRPSGTYHLEVQLVPGYERIVRLQDTAYLICQDEGYALLRDEGWQQPGRRAGPAPSIRQLEKSGKNDYRFAMACPSFTRSPSFRFRLDPFDRGWSNWQSEPVKEYTNLPPGEYRFLVQSKYSDETAIQTFSIPPPWYASKWAFLVYLLLAAGFWAGLYRLSRWRLKQERRKLEAEKRRELEKERMEAEIRSKNSELANVTMNLLRKNEVLGKIKDELQQLPVAGEASRDLKKLLRLIDGHITGDQDWELLEESFNNVHGNFFKKIKAQYENLTPGDLRLAAYLKMNLSSKEIAQLLNISVRGVENKRYRLRKKLGLPEEENLAEFMIKF